MVSIPVGVGGPIPVLTGTMMNDRPEDRAKAKARQQPNKDGSDDPPHEGNRQKGNHGATIAPLQTLCKVRAQTTATAASAP
jgi:hypothetical protein